MWLGIFIKNLLWDGISSVVELNTEQMGLVNPRTIKR